MKHYRSSIIRAANIQMDDHVKIAGVMYRVAMISIHEIVSSNIVVTVYDLNEGPSLDTRVVLTMNENTPLKIYNQK